MTREPAVAGQFYRGTKEALIKEVSLYVEELPRESVIGALSPHAGFMYSGHVAGLVYSKIKLPQTIIILGPNHTGLGSSISIMTEGIWKIPLGDMEIDSFLAERIYRQAGTLIEKDSRAHLFEHSIEVQLPFIYYFKSDTRFVPISLMHASVDECSALGEAIARAVNETDYTVTIVASSDMSHYLSAQEARKLDFLAIERILEMDPEGLYNTVITKRISMCGYLAATTMLFAALMLGATRAELLKYANSGDINGDYSQVVGYAGVIVK